MAEPQGAPPASSASGVNRLRGHLGHLTQEESAALDNFKSISTEAGFYTPPGLDKKASHDDGTLVRYLRARKFVPQDAFEQFKDTEIWRKDNNLEALYEKIDIDDYQEARSVYPQWTGRRDKRGIPVYLFEVGKLDSKKMIAYSSATSKSKVKGPSPSRMLRLFALYENLTRFVMPLCSSVPGRPNPETPVDQSNNIVDISHVGLKQFWNLRSHMQDASQLATAHYPETLDRIFIIGAPSFFPTVWGWIKKWFDPITTSKIFILSDKDVYPTLSAFIEHESIPKKYGGDLDFECGKLPLLDPPVRAALDLRGSEELFLTAPVRWMDDENGEMMALGVGTVDGHPRKERMATLHSLAMETLTRSSTHQGQQAQAYPDTAQTQSQPAQPAVLDTLHRRSTASSSRPVSRYREQTIVPQHDDLPAKTQPSQPLNSTAADRDSTYSSAQSDDQRHDQYARKASSITEYQSQSHTQPGQPAISGDSDQKPTFLNYRPDGPVQQSNIDLPAQRNPQDDVPSATQPTPPSLSASPPSQPTSPPQELTSPPSQTTTSPVLTKSPAPLADRLNPHSNTSETELAKSLKATSPRGQSMANGKPKQIQMPQRPATLDRTETVYMTPASDPSEIPKQFS